MPIYYFTGHAHRDRVFFFQKGETIIPQANVVASKDIVFIQTTTLASSGESYWGIREVKKAEDGNVTYQMDCSPTESCLPNKSNKPEGFQSVPAGNYWVEYRWGNTGTSLFLGGDGKTPEVTATEFLFTCSTMVH